MKPKFATVFAELYLKVSEEEKAFPYIEQLSTDQSPQGQRPGGGVRPGLDQDSRPQLATIATEPVFLHLRL